MVGQASSLSIKNDGQDARRHQILFLSAITLTGIPISLQNLARCDVGAGFKPALGCVSRKRFYGSGRDAVPGNR
jgi:hypothetical protein